MASSAELRITQKIAEEIGSTLHQVVAAVGLLDEGATVPFVARYRKEVTGGLDDTQLRTLDERLSYLRELEERRAAILASIDEQGKLTPELAAQIDAAETKQSLEDLYLPYKQKRRTKAQIAREAGIAPLAEALLADPTLKPEDEAAKFINAEAGFADVKAVLDGARQILMEQFSEDAALLGKLREYLEEHGIVKSTVVEGKETEGAKFRDYFDYSEAVSTVPSHRALALFRGRNEGALQVALVLDSELDEANKPIGHNPCEARIAKHFGITDQGRAADKWLADTVRWTWRIKVFMHLELDLMNALRERWLYSSADASAGTVRQYSTLVYPQLTADYVNVDDRAFPRSGMSGNATLRGGIGGAGYAAGPPGQLPVWPVRAGQPAPCGPGGYPVRPAETAGRRLCGGSARQPGTINAAAG